MVVVCIHRVLCIPMSVPGTNWIVSGLLVAAIIKFLVLIIKDYYWKNIYALITLWTSFCCYFRSLGSLVNQPQGSKEGYCQYRSFSNCTSYCWCLCLIMCYVVSHSGQVSVIVLFGFWTSKFTNYAWLYCIVFQGIDIFL